VEGLFWRITIRRLSRAAAVTRGRRRQDNDADLAARLTKTNGLKKRVFIFHGHEQLKTCRTAHIKYTVAAGSPALSRWEKLSSLFHFDFLVQCPCSSFRSRLHGTRLDSSRLRWGVKSESYDKINNGCHINFSGLPWYFVRIAFGVHSLEVDAGKIRLSIPRNTFRILRFV
jgi:hypothetical protein